MLAPLQILNQFSILLVLYFTFSLFIGLESKLVNFSTKFNSVVKFVGSLTLQIYLVQFVIINQLSNLVFPLNLIVVVSCILLVAIVVYLLEHLVRKFIAFIINKFKLKKVKND